MIAFDLTLREALKELDIPFSDEMIAKAALYAAYLLDENQKMNLTAIVDEREMAIKHFADSLALLRFYPLPQRCLVADIGSGAGFPGMALRIFRPDLKITLIDSLKKRCYFLERLCKELAIDDVNVVWGRAEELGQSEDYRERFDFATARAVAPLPTLLEYAAPFIKPGGVFLALKAKEEADGAENALSTLHCALKKKECYELYGEERSLFIIEKTAALAKKYPRRPGMPEKRPL